MLLFEDIWIYLGDGGAESDQILFQHSRFHLRQAEWVPKPVTRVTWIGAQAYARHYGKRLPTHNEWQTIKQQFSIEPDSTEGPTKDTMHSQMQGVALSPNDSSTQNELFDGMSTGTARIIIEREVRRQISEEFNNASSDATQIIDAIFDILEKFVGEVKIEDDITSVIIKMQN